jgi:HTH-type transcriptional regulator/antitoxin HipB
LDALKAQMEVFEDELQCYEQLKNKEIPLVNIGSFTDLHEPLIKARIARGWTQADLAQKLQLKEQQIQRYEQSNYATASMFRMQEVATALNIEIKKFTVQIVQPEFYLELSGGAVNNLEEMRSRHRLLAV